MYCASQGWTFEIISDLGSGMNYQKKGLKKLLDEIISEKIGRLVVTHKDRLLRFGGELVFAICAAKEVEIVIINKGEDATFEEDLAKDVLEIITVFSARLYGSRSRKNQRLIDGKKAVMEAHFVHEQENGKGLAAVAVLFSKGAKNKFYDSILGHLPLKVNTERQYKDIIINAHDLLPKNTSQYYFYQSSLTTHPCTEPLKWFVLPNKVELFEAQIKNFPLCIL